jgi:hypothetical protein
MNLLISWRKTSANKAVNSDTLYVFAALTTNAPVTAGVIAFRAHERGARMKTVDIIELAVNFSSALLLFVGLMYTGRQLHLTRIIHKQNHDWNRRHAAQQALFNYSTFISGTEQLNKTLGYVTATEPLPLADVEDTFQKNPELRVTCHKLLNFNETLAIGIIHGLYDEEIIKNAWRGNMLRSFDSFRNYIIDFRQNGRPLAFKEQEMIGNKWRNEMTKKDFRDTSDAER